MQQLPRLVVQDNLLELLSDPGMAAEAAFFVLDAGILQETRHVDVSQQRALLEPRMEARRLVIYSGANSANDGGEAQDGRVGGGRTGQQAMNRSGELWGRGLSFIRTTASVIV